MRSSWTCQKSTSLGQTVRKRQPLPGLLQPLVESIGVLGELLTQLVVLLLPPLLLLQLQLSLLHSQLQTPVRSTALYTSGNINNKL